MSLGFLSGNKAQDGAGFAVRDSSQVEMEQSQVYNNSAISCGAIMAAANGVRLNITSSVFKNNLVLNTGGNLYAQSSSFVTITNCSFFGNVAKTGYGGAILVALESTLRVSNSIFAQNTAGFRGGGAIAIPDSAYVLLDNCSLSDNIFGAILVERGSSLRVRNSKMYNHSSADIGGVIFVNMAMVHLANVHFEGNYAHLGGGTIFAQRNSRVTITDCFFIHNEAYQQGGAVEAEMGVIVHINNTSFAGNHAKNGGALSGLQSAYYVISSSLFTENYAAVGGALYVTNYCRVNVSNCKFIGDVVDDGGGAIGYQNSELQVNNSVFQNNTGSGYGGGAVQVNDNSILKITDSIMSENKVPTRGSGGAIIMQNKVAVIIQNVTFSGNIAGNVGGAIAASSDIILQLNKSYFHKNQNNEYYGGAIYMEDDSIMVLYDCIFDENISEESGCIYLDRSIGYFANSTFARNSIKGPMVQLEGGAFDIRDSDVYITNSTLSDNIGGAMKIDRSSIYTYTCLFNHNNASLKSSDKYFEEKAVKENIIHIGNGKVNINESPYASCKLQIFSTINE